MTERAGPQKFRNRYVSVRDYRKIDKTRRTPAQHGRFWLTNTFSEWWGISITRLAGGIGPFALG